MSVVQNFLPLTCRQFIAYSVAIILLLSLDHGVLILKDKFGSFTDYCF
jgi:hypothetical protein